MSMLGSRAALAALAALTALAPAATAQTWTGVTASGSWNTSGNWSTNSIPNSSTATVTFNDVGTGFNSVNVQSAVQAKSLTFNTTTVAYTLTGTQISGLTDIFIGSSVTGTQAVSNNLVVSGGATGTGPFTITNNAPLGSTPTLVLSGAIGTQDLGGIVVTGTGFTRISGGIGAVGGVVLGQLIKTGSGRLELTGNNAGLFATQTSNVSVTLSGGTLAINSDAALGMAGKTLILNANSATAGGLEFLNGGVNIARPVTLSSVNRFVSNGSDVNTISSVISASSPAGTSGAIVKDGTGTLVLTGSNSFGSGVTINAGTLSVSSDNNLGVSGTDGQGQPFGGLTLAGGSLEVTSGMSLTRQITLAGGAISVDPGVTLFIGSTASGTGPLIKTGAGDIQLFNGGSTYTGGTAIQQGRIILRQGNALPTNTTLTLGSGTNSGILDLNGNGQQVAGLAVSGTGTANAVTNNSSFAAALTVSAAASQTYAGGLMGNLAVVKAGAGTLTLSNTGNSYTGGTTLNAGSLAIAADGALGAAASGVSFNGGTLNTTASFSSARAFSINSAGGTISVSSGANLTLSSALSGTGDLTKTSPGGLLLSADSSGYSGGVTISGGVVKLGNANALAGSTVTVSVNSGLDPNGLAAVTLGGLAGTGSMALGATALTVGGNNADSSFSGPFTSGTGAFTKVGAGTLTLGGNNSNFTGGTVLTGGTVSVSNSSELGGTTSGLTFNGGALATTAGVSTSRGVTVNANGGAANVASGTTLTLSGMVTGTGTLSTNGPGTLALSGNNSNFTGGLTVGAGVVRLGSVNALVNALATVNVNGGLDPTGVSGATLGGLAGTGNIAAGTTALTVGRNNANTTYSGALTGTGGLTKAGTGTLTLAGDNSNFGGPVAVNGGVLQAGATTALSSGMAVSLANTAGAALDLNGFSPTIGSLAGGGSAGGNVTLGSGSLTVGASNTSTAFAGSVTGTGSLTKAGTGTLTLSGSGSSADRLFVSSGGITVGSGSLTLMDADGPILVGGFSGTSTGVLTVSGGGVVAAPTVNDPNNYSQIDGGTASAVVTGAGSQLNVGGDLTVGVVLVGNLTVQNGGSSKVGGTLAVGLGSTQSNSGGTLLIQSGGTVTSANGDIGAGITANGTAMVTGPGSAWTISSQLALGGNASQAATTSQLTITNGGAVTVAGATTFYSSVGSLTVNGGTFTTGSIILANGALPSILLSDPVGGAALTFGSDNTSTAFAGTFADAAGGPGTAVKVGTGTWTLTGTLTNTGGLTINDGAAKLGAANVLSATTATVNVNGGLNLNGFSAVALGGLAGTGSISLGTTALTVGGANVDTTYSGALTGAGSLTKAGTGTLTLSGTGSNVASLTVGAGGVTVGGGTLTLTASNFAINVGGGSPTALTVSGGGTVTTTNGAGAIDGPAGTGAVVTGAGSQLHTATDLYVGLYGSGGLTAQNGGSVLIDRTLVLGLSGGNTGTLLVQAGGTVSSLFGNVGVNPGSTGTINVTGAGSAWSNASSLILGGSSNTVGGIGLLTVANGGSVTIGTRTTLLTSLSSITINGGTLTTGSLAVANGATPSILLSDPVGGSALTIGTDNSSTFYAGPFVDGAGGPGTVAKVGSGTLTLTGHLTNTGGYKATGGAIDFSGAVIQPGAGTLTAGAGATIQYDTGARVFGGFLHGPGTHVVTGGATLSGTSTNNSTVVSVTGAATFSNFSNSGALSVMAGLTAVPGLSSFINQGSGSITIGAASKVNAADFQSYGTLTINPAATGSPFTELVNTGTSPMFFNGGSRTFIGTPATATASPFVAGVDVHGQNLVVAGGLFVNNGFVADSNPGGGGSIIVDFGALYKGAGTTFVPLVTQNGGKVQAGNSPGSAGFGRFVFGPGGVNNYVFAIDDATGTAGPSPDAAGHVSGWGLVKAVQQTFGATTSSGDFVWTATPSNKLTFAIDTLVNPTTVGTDVTGPMADFDPSHSYSWPAVRWAGTYSGPADAAALNADTTFDTSAFLNPVAGTFGWNLDPASQTLSLIYTPVPEPGSLALAGLAAVGWVTFWRRRLVNGPKNDGRNLRAPEV